MRNLKTAEVMVDQVLGNYPDLPILSREMRRVDFANYARQIGCSVLWVHDLRVEGAFIHRKSTFDGIEDGRSDRIRDQHGDRIAQLDDAPNGYFLLSAESTEVQEKLTFGHEAGHALLMRAGIDTPAVQHIEDPALEMAAELLSVRINLRPGSLSIGYEPADIFEKLDEITTLFNVSEIAVLARAMTDKVIPRAVQLFDDIAYNLVTLSAVLDNFSTADSADDAVGQIEIAREYDGPSGFSLPVDRPRQLQLLCGISKREHKEWMQRRRENIKLGRLYRELARTNR